MIRSVFWGLCFNEITVAVSIFIVLLFWKKAERVFTLRAWKCVCLVVLIRLFLVVPGFEQMTLFHLDITPKESVLEVQEYTVQVQQDAEYRQIQSDNEQEKSINKDAETKTVTTKGANGSNKESIKGNPRISWEDNISSDNIMILALLLWLIIAILRLMYTAVSYVLLYCDLQQANNIIKDDKVRDLLDEVLAEYAIVEEVDVYLSRKVTSPLVLGIEEPFIVVPDLDYTVEEWEFIFRHECMHLKKKDMVVKMLFQLAKCLHWWNPLVWRFCHRVNDFLEECCDYYVVESKEYEYRKAYCNNILNVLEKNAYKKAIKMIGTSGLDGGKAIMKHRMSRILSPQVKKSKGAYLALIYLMIGSSVFLIGCGEQNEDSTFINDTTQDNTIVSDVSMQEKDKMEENTWYQRTKLVSQDMKLRELKQEELEMLSQIQEELFLGLSDDDINEIKEKLAGVHGGLESEIVYYDMGTLTNPDSEAWERFNDTTPDDYVDNGHWGPDVIQDLDEVKGKLSDVRVQNLITEAQNEIQAIMDEHSNVNVMKAHTILHDLDYWLFRYPVEDFQYAPADWSGIYIYYGELDELLEK